MELLGIYSIIYIDTRNCATEIIYKHDDEARWHEDSVDYRLRRWGTKKRQIRCGLILFIIVELFCAVYCSKYPPTIHVVQQLFSLLSLINDGGRREGEPGETQQNMIRLGVTFKLVALTWVAPNKITDVAVRQRRSRRRREEPIKSVINMEGIRVSFYLFFVPSIIAQQAIKQELIIRQSKIN